MTKEIDTAVARAMGYEITNGHPMQGQAFQPKYPCFFDWHEVQEYYDHLVFCPDRETSIDWLPSTKPKAWQEVERFMAEKFSVADKVTYASILQSKFSDRNNHLLGVFAMLTAPLEDRCLAFLKAMEPVPVPTTKPLTEWESDCEFGHLVTVSWKRGPAEIFRNVTGWKTIQLGDMKQLLLESNLHWSSESLQMSEMDGWEAVSEFGMGASFWEGRITE